MSSRRHSLYFDSDGTEPGTHVIVLDEEGQYVGELGGIHRIRLDLEHGGKMSGTLTVVDLPGRALTRMNRISVREISLTGSWWQRLRRRFLRRWRLA